ncbi:MAG TPA: polysaccharide biosynthesis tyrosine autokinase [Bryobacteraceae bacterium]|nr:polysaccharide biosynthesis tyrosine autokinase [Bryobacteraceae bacterium]
MSDMNPQLPVAVEKPAPTAPVPAETYRAASYGYDIESDQTAVPLAHYLWILKRHRWRILSFVCACVIATLIISTRLTPIYESTATIDVDRQMPTSIIGQDALRAPLNDSDQFLATQMKLIQSDSVLRPVVERFHLLDLDRESASVAPQRAAASESDAPVLLRKLKVTRPPNTYLLLISFRSPDPRLAADVANAVAHSYVEHTYNIRFRSAASLSSFMERQLEELKSKMERSSSALAQFERELNVINPEEKTSILSARLLQLNTEYTNAQAERVRKEAAWKSVRGGTLEAAQVSTQGEALKMLAEKLDEAQQKFVETKAHYGPNHPEYKKAAAQVQEISRQLRAARENAAQRVEVEYREAVNREAMLQKTVSETKAEFDRLNARSFEYNSLKREAEADKSLYEELVRKIKEAGINAGFQNNSIRIADSARPAVRPVFPNLPLNLVLAALFSTLLAVGVAVLSDVLDSSIRDPERVATLLQTDVLGSLPLVKPWRRHLVVAQPADPGVTALTKKAKPPEEKGTYNVTGFEEAVRTLRNSILLGSFDRRLSSLMVTSASPSEGKTTIAVHLALAHAQQKHKTLLIDGDLRRPSVSAKFNIEVQSGLAAALQNGMQWKEKLVKIEDLPELDVLPCGHTSRRAADLIGAALPRILEEAAGIYSLVIVDAPPLLGFSEPLQMAAAVDGVVIVAKAGHTNRKAVASVVSTLQRVRANVIGLVLNEATKDISDTYHYYGYYGRYYKYYKAAS